MSTPKITLLEAMREWMDTIMIRFRRENMQYWKSQGISFPQSLALMQLHHKNMCGVSDIAGFLDVTPAAASQMIDKLVQEGYVERAEDPNDRRVKQLTLTSKGKRMIEKTHELNQTWLSDLAHSLAPDEQAEISNALTRLTKAARQLDAEKVL